MSSMDEATLEYFLRDSFRRLDTATESFAFEICEPYRQSIEHAMDEFDEETQSWRDYRNSMWGVYIPDSVGEAITAFMERSKVDHIKLLQDKVPAEHILRIFDAYDARSASNVLVVGPTVREFVANRIKDEELADLKKKLEIAEFNLAATQDALDNERKKVKILEGKLTIADLDREVPPPESSKSDHAPAAAESKARSGDVVSLSSARVTKLDNNTHWTIPEMLRSDAVDFENGQFSATHAVVLYLNKPKGTEDYTTSYTMCNIQASEAIALMNVITQQLANRMLGIYPNR